MLLAKDFEKLIGDFSSADYEMRKTSAAFIDAWKGPQTKKDSFHHFNYYSTNLALPKMRNSQERGSF